MSEAKKGATFIYPLETLLKVREIRETQEQDKFKEAERKVIEEKKKEDELKEIEKLAYNDLSESMASGELPDMGEIQRKKQNLDVLKEKVEAQIQVVKDAEIKKEEQRVVLTKASMDKQVIEKDREKTREAWKKIMIKEENKFLDEIASIQFSGKMRKGEEENLFQKNKKNNNNPTP
jgi:flagellar protein FliJ